MTRGGEDKSGARGAGSSLQAELARAMVASRLFGPEVAPMSLGPYALTRQIGAGGMGLVFEACDARTGQRLAIKMLRKRSPAELSLLRREFRALADIHHGNLVQLYELTVEDGIPLLAMELVEGDSLMRFVRPRGALDCDRLRATLRQLVDAISTLHAAGVLHRDLKPGNVLVQPDGRLVVLDFGLALLTSEQGPGMGSGTPRYLAPERRRGRPASPASDWFGVGLILHEALAGAPLDGADVPKLPAALHASASTADLCALCAQLLDHDPERRPSAARLRAALALPERPRPWSPLRPIGAASQFFGREGELGRLHAALGRALGGENVRVHVRGEPGIGKTTLLKHFLREAQDRHALTVLKDRCYEAELVPFNAVDGLIEAIARELTRLPEAERPAQEDAAELLRLFPALRGALRGDGQVRDSALVDPHLLRQYAFGQLRAVLQVLARRRPLVVHLDDLQWGDADSAQLLEELLRVPAPAPLLLLASYRSGSAEQSECVRRLRELDRHAPGSALEIDLGPLEHEAAVALARAFAEAPADEAALRAMAAESAGNPLFLRALTERASHRAGRSASARESFHGVVQAAVQRLPGPSRELLELVALSPGPLAREVLLRAAELGEERAPWPEHLALLQRAGLLCGAPGRRGAVESYHDRLRESVTCGLDPGRRRRHHARLAAAEAAAEAPDPEFLAYHFEGAGELSEAVRHAEAAAERAAEHLAFERAAEWFGAALRCGSPRRDVLLRKRADALAYGGLSMKAAEAYAAAAEANRGTAQEQECIRRSAEMYLASGRLNDGLAMFRPLLRAAGLRIPETRWQTVASILWDMAWLAARGIEFEPGEPAAAERWRVQLYISVGTGLLVVDETSISVAFLLKGLRLALATGDAEGVGKALPIYASVLSWNPRNAAKVERCFELAERLGRELRNPEILAWVSVIRAVTALQAGRFEPGLALARQAQAATQFCSDGGFQLGSARHFECAVLAYGGLDMHELRVKASECLTWARSRGDFWLSTTARIDYALGRLAADDGDAALAEVESANDTWVSEADIRLRSGAPMQEIEVHALVVRVHCKLYLGQVESAYRDLEDCWPALRGGPGARVPGWRLMLNLLRARTALSAAAHGIEPERALAKVRDVLRTAERTQQLAWASAVEALARAGLAAHRGDQASAIEQLRRAAAEFDRSGMALHAHAMRFRAGELIGGSEGDMQRERAETAMRSLGVACPARWADVYAPQYRASSSLG